METSKLKEKIYSLPFNRLIIVRKAIMKDLQISKMTYYRILNGQSEPTELEKDHIAKILNTKKHLIFPKRVTTPKTYIDDNN